MLCSSVTQKYQATIPREIRHLLNIQQGDRIAFNIVDGQVMIKKITPLDLEFHRALEFTLNEWNSDADNKAYDDL